jgi:hypothetical protein
MAVVADACGICDISLTVRDSAWDEDIDGNKFWQDDWVAIKCDELDWYIDPDNVWDRRGEIDVKDGTRGIYAAARVNGDSLGDNMDLDIKFMGTYLNRANPDFSLNDN